MKASRFNFNIQPYNWTLCSAHCVFGQTVDGGPFPEHGAARLSNTFIEMLRDRVRLTVSVTCGFVALFMFRKYM